MYVACTRARNHLYVSYPSIVHDRAMGPVPSRVSRFLDDVPGGLIDSVRLVEEGEEDWDD